MNTTAADKWAEATEEALFEGFEPPAPVEDTRSAGQRLTDRQRDGLALGRHPLTGGPLTEDVARTCGNCAFRQLFSYHLRSYPKCVNDRVGRIAHSATTDVRAWWPACREHEYGEPKLSPDAARWVP